MCSPISKTCADSLFDSKNIIDSFSATTGDTIVKHITTSNNISVLPFSQISDEQLTTDIHGVKTSVHTSIQDKINELD